jgi:GNAT superfamily N-acetyltransferase
MVVKRISRKDAKTQNDQAEDSMSWKVKWGRFFPPRPGFELNARLVNITMRIGSISIDPDEVSGVSFRVNPEVTNESLNELFGAAWPTHSCRDFRPVLERSLIYVCAFEANRLVGFVNVAWDGGLHAFLLDTTVHPQWRRRGIGRNLVRHAEYLARTRGMEWLHVDFDSELREFYYGCGFRPTEAGLIRLAGSPLS